MATKRNVSDLVDDEETSERPHRRPRLSDLLSSAPQTSAEPVEQKLAYPSSNSKSLPSPTPFQKPLPLLTFSYTPSRILEFNDSAMRYFVQPPLQSQLSYGYERWIRRPEEKGRVDGLVTAWDRARKRMELDGGRSGTGGMEVGLVAWRGVMTRILTAPYEEKEGWEMNVMCVHGTMYFEEHISDAKLAEKNNIEPRHRLQTYYGYAFESYCTSLHPSRKEDSDAEVPGWGGDVNTSVQWCSVVKTKLGNTRMVIGGEVDCVRGKHTGQTDNFVELKTSMAIRGRRDEERFEKKLLKFYFQSFLLGVPEIIVGFRTPSGEITTVQSFKTINIPRLVRGKLGAWNPLVCLEWGNQFLTFLKSVVQNHNADRDSRVWRVQFKPQVGINVFLLDKAGVEEVVAGENRLGFLPRWYWDELGKDNIASVPPRPRTSTDAVPARWKI